MAILGFTILAILIALYAYTSGRLFSSLATRGASLYIASFYCLSTAVFIWLLASIVGDNTSLFIFAADIMLLIASGLMLSITVNFRQYPYAVPIAGLVATLLLTARAFIEPSASYIDNGLLHFNLSLTASLAIGALLFICWLPAGYIALRPVVRTLGGNVFFIYTSAILMTCFFIASVKPLMIIVSFIGIIFMFLALIVTNIAAEYILRKQKVKHPEVKHAATK